MSHCSERIYENAGNPALLRLASPLIRCVLDVGCGAGDNARLLRRMVRSAALYGITASPSEAALASEHMHTCWVADLEVDSLEFLGDLRFDCLILSHVLEHLVNPARALERLLRYVTPGGEVLIAVPNVLHWRCRARLATGHFNYEDAGVLDRTHLRFFTVASAPRELVDPVPDLELTSVAGEGDVPLWLLRRHVLPPRMSRKVDALGVRLAPGLFASQILLVCRKRHVPPVNPRSGNSSLV